MESEGPQLQGPLEEGNAVKKMMEEFGIDPKHRPSHGSKIAAAVKESEMLNLPILMGWSAADS